MVREHVENARLIGIPRGVEESWRSYMELYSVWLIETGRMQVPATVFVALPQGGAFHTALVRHTKDGRIRFLV